ncbi:dienelactone hydrolase endo-1,3,1,4-beta-D-glucanase [Crucibulum laeve]|uniref:Dienelactone hydrolase endo-1,3,1,4-beta-D-glucanase n=1 Tax=Crucibulum laeve TaxID=68775 RepID=A0A5C3LP29_9AGAR|nr:dienelactone hydrolase endo-1,3,1,4-beta-D-glucanase [Crucibulum laeve]
MAPILHPDQKGGHKIEPLCFSDAFGLPLKNSKILADNLSHRLLCDVWVPDLFDGKPLIKVGQLKLPDRAGVKRSTFDWIKFVFAVLPSLPGFIKNRPKVVDARINLFITKLKSEKSYAKVGAVGYCFGGTAAVRLGSTDLIDCIVICHPGRFNLTLVNSIKVPSSWACAEDDESFSTNSRKEAEAILSTMKKNGNASEYEFIDYKGTAHGFAARPNLAIPEVKQGYEKSFEQTVAWFQKFL